MFLRTQRHIATLLILAMPGTAVMCGRWAVECRIMKVNSGGASASGKALLTVLHMGLPGSAASAGPR